MIVSINQPSYLPWMGYFNRIIKADIHVVLDHVQFEKNSFTNRNKIKTKDGTLMLTVPLKTKGKFGDLSIDTIETANDNWKKNHFKNLESAYLKSPFFQKYRHLISTFYNNDSVKLIEIIKPINDWVLTELEISTPIIYSSNLKISSTKSELILDICKHLKATTYLSGPIGREYLNIQNFNQNNIEVKFDDYSHPTYNQFNGDFEPCMCILDLLFNYGTESKHFFNKN